MHLPQSCCFLCSFLSVYLYSGWVYFCPCFARPSVRPSLFVCLFVVSVFICYRLLLSVSRLPILSHLFVFVCLSVFVPVRACVRACDRLCVRPSVCASVRLCVRLCSVSSVVCVCALLVLSAFLLMFVFFSSCLFFCLSSVPVPSDCVLVSVFVCVLVYNILFQISASV